MKTKEGLPSEVDQLFSRRASIFVKGLRVADYNPAGLAFYAYYQGREDEYWEQTQIAAPVVNGETVLRPDPGYQFYKNRPKNSISRK